MAIDQAHTLARTIYSVMHEMPKFSEVAHAADYDSLIASDREAFYELARKVGERMFMKPPAEVIEAPGAENAKETPT